MDAAVTYVNSLRTGPEVTHLINYAMNTCLTIAWHTSYRWSTTQSARRWGDSVVVLLGRAGRSFKGKLRAALTHSARWPAYRGLNIIWNKPIAMSICWQLPSMRYHCERLVVCVYSDYEPCGVSLTESASLLYIVATKYYQERAQTAR